MNLSYLGLFPFRSQSNTTVAEPEPQAELYYSLTGASSNKSPASLVWVSSKSLPVAVVAVGVDSVAVVVIIRVDCFRLCCGESSLGLDHWILLPKCADCCLAAAATVEPADQGEIIAYSHSTARSHSRPPGKCFDHIYDSQTRVETAHLYTSSTPS